MSTNDPRRPPSKPTPPSKPKPTDPKPAPVKPAKGNADGYTTAPFGQSGGQWGYGGTA